MPNPIESLATMLIDSADAPELRAQVAELQAAVTALTAERDALRVENVHLRADYEFYLCAFCEKPVKVAEDAWGG